ncbi:MAG TPA: glycosyltransferase family 9 protein, partial [Candidatus Hydrogenedentes bacterium]|nr:glycosyltransferase family 9 protein [Candidatus Hydrogenedentota bacterium]
MRILVLQTTRMGDVLQTSPLIRGIRERYPDAHIAVLVRRMGRAVAERHPDIDEVIVYEEDELFLDLRANDSERLLRAYDLAEERIRALREEGFDLAYNVTHSIASAMLLKLAGIPKVVGAHLSDEGQFVLRGAWTTYFFTSIFHREYNDLNLCDISRHFEPGVSPPRLVFEVRDADRAAADALLERRGVPRDAFLVCMQLGASEENKRWSEAHFARLARLLRDRYQARILLVGVREEAVLGEVFEGHAPGLAVPLYGETTIPELGALLERARVLVTNDTGTMHIAAAVNCPVALVSVGHVHYRETGPYGEGHCAVEWRRDNLGTGHEVPGGLDERELVQPEHALRAVECALRFRETGRVEPVADMPELAPIDLYVTCFAPDGCLEYYPALRRPMTQRDFLRCAYRLMWLDHLGGEGRNVEAQQRESIQRLLRCHDGPDAEAVRAWMRELDGDFEGLAQLAQRGVGATDGLLDHLRGGGGMAKAKDL